MAYNWIWLAPSEGQETAKDITNESSISEQIIRVSPKTDIWRPDESTDVFNAPCIVSTIKASQFQSFTATVSAEWKTLYDQGGIILAFPSEAGSKSSMKQWIKAGIEVFDGAPKLGVVGTYRFSDWSLSPMVEQGQQATFKAERVGETLWIYAIKGGEKHALREIKWAFLEERRSDVEMIVGIYGAKPTPDEDDAGKELSITFRDIALVCS